MKWLNVFLTEIKDTGKLSEVHRAKLCPIPGN